MAKFENILERKYTTGAEAVEIKYGNRYFIKMGYCGFNSAANNRMGYDSQAKAEAAILRYQNK